MHDYNTNLQTNHAILQLGITKWICSQPKLVSGGSPLCFLPYARLQKTETNVRCLLKMYQVNLFSPTKYIGSFASILSKILVRQPQFFSLFFCIDFCSIRILVRVYP